MITETRFKYEFERNGRAIVIMNDKRMTESEQDKYARLLGEGCRIVETLPKTSPQPFRIVKTTGELYE